MTYIRSYGKNYHTFYGKITISIFTNNNHFKIKKITIITNYNYCYVYNIIPVLVFI